MTPPAESPPSSGVPSASSGGSPAQLRRVLGLGDLIFYGIVLIQPVGAVGPFGLANQMSKGHVTLTIFIALVAMMLTAVSYGRMAGRYPAAGSAYTYVGRGLNPHLGFISGWAMFLDYLVIPIVSVVYGALTLQKIMNDLAPSLGDAAFAHWPLPLAPERVCFLFWAVLLVAAMTVLNVRGIKWTARANEIMTAAMCLVIVVFVADAARFLVQRQGWMALFSSKPFYNPKTFNLSAIGSATSLAALTYIGFDGITTLSEEVREPRKTVPLAIVLVCVIIGICAGAQVYLGQLVWPDYSTFKDLDTAFFDVCKLVGGSFLFYSMTAVMAVACLGSALTGQVGAARILFGMGRDGALPRFFARLNRRNNPVLNIWLIAVLVTVGVMWLNYEQAALLINFGAFLAFMGVNLAAIREFWFRPQAGTRRNWVADVLVPGLGFIFCLVIWLSLKPQTKLVGGCWCAAGLIYLGCKTRGFTQRPEMIELP